MKRLAIAAFSLVLSGQLRAQELFRVPDNVSTRWASFENRNATKGGGGRENKGAKGHPAEMLAPGEHKILLDTKGAGIIQRIWLTIDNRSPAMLRSLRLEMYWDGDPKPAVAAPLGDFFGVGLGRKLAFQNALFSDPEGKSFNCNIPMPYRTAARIVLVNDGSKAEMLFYDIDFLQVASHASDVMYFHTFWSRDRKPELGKDYGILPGVRGKGRFLGVNMGLITDPLYEKSWWGEGEVKVYLDGDSDFPTLCGTGSEDYLGSGWGQGKVINQFQGCLVAGGKYRQWAFYRYHIPDPIYFSSDCKVTIQLMGGDMLPKVREMASKGARLIPVTIGSDKGNVNLFEKNPVPRLDDKSLPEGWTNFYRSDDVSSTAYFYLDKTSSGLPSLASVAERTAGLPEKYDEE